LPRDLQVEKWVDQDRKQVPGEEIGENRPRWKSGSTPGLKIGGFLGVS
jgi:hypothetical protein